MLTAHKTSRFPLVVSRSLISYERERVRASNPKDMTAWDLYLRGLSAIHLGTDESMVEAENLARQAIARDAGFGPGHSLLSFAIAMQTYRHAGKRNQSHFEEMLREAKLAVELDDRDTMAWTFLGLALGINGDYDEGIAASRHAVELNPYALLPHVSLGNCYFFSGQISDSVLSYQEALRIGGSDADILHAHGMMLWVQYMARDYDAACISGRKAELLAPDYLQIQIALAATFGQMGQTDRARSCADKIITTDPNFSCAKFRRNVRWRDTAMIEHAVDGLLKAGLPE